MSSASSSASSSGASQRPLYTPEERVRRDSSKWTLVQGLLAPIQFVIFGISLYLVLNYLNTGEHYEWAVWSVVAKTMALYTIMITGAIWEKVVFGQYLFHESFFWEDVFSMLVIVLHTLYLFGLFTGIADDGVLFATALAAYVAYVINAAQFIWKLRMARLSSDAAKAKAGTESAAPPASLAQAA
ncbi:MAG: 2-vinyl bacteriochlorophyllide hydratase [Sphingomonadales bacterium]